MRPGPGSVRSTADSSRQAIAAGRGHSSPLPASGAINTGEAPRRKNNLRSTYGSTPGRSTRPPQARKSKTPRHGSGGWRATQKIKDHTNAGPARHSRGRRRAAERAPLRVTSLARRCHPPCPSAPPFSKIDQLEPRAQPSSRKAQQQRRAEGREGSPLTSLGARRAETRGGHGRIL